MEEIELEDVSVDEIFRSPTPEIELVGLSEHLNSESMGGNAGASHSAANATLEGGCLVFTNYSSREFGRSCDATLKVGFPNAGLALSYMLGGGIEVPRLIDEVVMWREDHIGKREVEEMVLKHNAYNIGRY